MTRSPSAILPTAYTPLAVHALDWRTSMRSLALFFLPAFFALPCSDMSLFPRQTDDCRSSRRAPDDTRQPRRRDTLHLPYTAAHVDKPAKNLWINARVWCGWQGGDMGMAQEQCRREGGSPVLIRMAESSTPANSRFSVLFVEHPNI